MSDDFPKIDKLTLDVFTVEQAASWPDFLCDAIPINTGQWMEFALRYRAQNVEYSTCPFSTLVLQVQKRP